MHRLTGLLSFLRILQVLRISPAFSKFQKTSETSNVLDSWSFKHSGLSKILRSPLTNSRPLTAEKTKIRNQIEDRSMCKALPRTFSTQRAGGGQALLLAIGVDPSPCRYRISASRRAKQDSTWAEEKLYQLLFCAGDHSRADCTPVSSDTCSSRREWLSCHRAQPLKRIAPPRDLCMGPGGTEDASVHTDIETAHHALG